MTRSSCEDAAAVVDPVWCGKDEGYRAEAYESNDTTLLEVRLVCHLNGELVYTKSVWRTTERTPKAYGEHARMLAVWQAIARYLNAGGGVYDLQLSFGKFLDDDDRVEINLPPDYFLLHTEQESTAKHTFANLQTGRAVVFNEDNYVEATSLDELSSEPSDAAEGDYIDAEFAPVDPVVDYDDDAGGDAELVGAGAGEAA